MKPLSSFLIFMSMGFLVACEAPTNLTSNSQLPQQMELLPLNSQEDYLVCQKEKCFSLQDKTFYLGLEPLLRNKSEVSSSPYPEMKTVYEKLSPHLAQRAESLRSITKKQVNITGASRSPASVKAIKKEGLDLQSEELPLAELKKLCQETGADTVTVHQNFVHCDWLTKPLSAKAEPKKWRWLLQGELKPGQDLQLSLSPEGHTRNDYLMEWQVFHRGQKIMNSTGHELRLPAVRSGSYTVHATIGGHQKETLSLIVE